MAELKTANRLRGSAKAAITKHKEKYNEYRTDFHNSGEPGKRDPTIMDFYIEKAKEKWTNLERLHEKVLELTEDKEQQNEADHFRYEEVVEKCVKAAMRDLYDEETIKKQAKENPKSTMNPWQSQVLRPDKLEHTVDYHKFRKWRKCYELYATQISLKDAGNDQQLNNVLMSMNPEMLALVTTNMGINMDAINLNYGDALDIIEKYLRGRRNKLLDLKTFLTMKKSKETPIDLFMVDFKEAALVADIMNTKSDELEAAVLAMSLEGDPVQQKIFKSEKKMSVDDIWKAVKIEEDANQTVSSLNNDESSVCAAKKSSYQKAKEEEKFKANQNSKEGQENKSDKSKAKSQKWCCWRCGRSERHFFKDCVAKDTTCNKCEEKGHFESQCEIFHKNKPKKSKSSSRCNLWHQKGQFCLSHFICWKWRDQAEDLS